MVDMRVRQDHGLNGGRVNRKRFPVPQAKLLVALEEAAIDKNTGLTRINEVFRPGNRAYAAQEFDLKRHVLCPR